MSRNGQDTRPQAGATAAGQRKGCPRAVHADEVDASELRANALINHDLYGFYGISVWAAEAEPEVQLLEQTKLIKFDRYAEFMVSDLLNCGLNLWATGLAPHYDVVQDAADNLDALVRALLSSPYRIRSNPHVDREGH